MSRADSLIIRKDSFVAVAAMIVFAFYLLVSGVASATLGPSLLQGWTCAQSRTAGAVSPSRDAPLDHHRQGTCCAPCQGKNVDLVSHQVSSSMCAPPDGGSLLGPAVFTNALLKASELSPFAPRGPPISYI